MLGMAYEPQNLKISVSPHHHRHTLLLYISFSSNVTLSNLIRKTVIKSSYTCFSADRKSPLNFQYWVRCSSQLRGQTLYFSKISVLHTAFQQTIWQYANLSKQAWAVVKKRAIGVSCTAAEVSLYPMYWVREQKTSRRVVSLASLLNQDN